ncbi:MAG: hypothetical protein ACYS0C_09165 [Planctomycetota bacterium]|jgi:hypothetical protein
MVNYEEKVESMLKRYRPLGPPTELKERIFESKVTEWNLALLVAAAGILIAVGVGLMWYVLLGPSGTEKEQVRLAMVERAIMREAQASQLLAVANVYAKRPSGEERAREIYNEVARLFQDLNAGKEAMQQVDSLPERRTR